MCAFIYSLTITTFSLYMETEDHKVINPENIISGHSQAPNQYRILAPLLYEILNKTLIHNSTTSDHIVIFVSILTAYLSAGILFYKSSLGSLTVSGLSLLALLGCFSFGMEWKYRQEFFEVTFVSLSLLTVLSVQKTQLLYSFLAVITFFGSLNRETYIFCLIAVTSHILWNRVAINKEPLSQHIIALAGLFSVFSFCFLGTRLHYGLSEYHSAFWMYKGNIQNLATFTSPYSLTHMGAGVLFAYITTVVLGNREYFAFVLGYGLPLLLVSGFISSFYEHRVFYPLILLFLASMVSFSFKAERANLNKSSEENS